MSEPGRFAVRVRASAAHWWTSPWLPEDDARALVRDLRDQLRSLSDGSAFLDFRAAGGRDIAIRARDVVAVELKPWHEGPPPPPAHLQGTVPAAGTDWLRQMSGGPR